MIRPDSLAWRVLPDGRVLDVIPLTFNRARLCVSRNAFVQWFEDCW